MTNLERVEQDGYYIEIVKEQTPEICLTAVQSYGWALQFVKKQTPEMCLIAVQRYVWALDYVKEQTPEICLAAIKQKPDVIRFIANSDCLNAIRKQHPELIAKLYDRP